jgi:hypothetical protein
MPQCDGDRHGELIGRLTTSVGRVAKEKRKRRVAVPKGKAKGRAGARERVCVCLRGLKKIKSGAHHDVNTSPRATLHPQSVHRVEGAIHEICWVSFSIVSKIIRIGALVCV